MIRTKTASTEKFACTCSVLPEASQLSALLMVLSRFGASTHGPFGGVGSDFLCARDSGGSHERALGSRSQNGDDLRIDLSAFSAAVTDYHLILGYYSLASLGERKDPGLVLASKHHLRWFLEECMEDRAAAAAPVHASRRSHG